MQSDTQNTSRYISVVDAARDLRVSNQLIWKLIRDGRLPAKVVRLATVIRIEKASWEAFLASGDELTPSKSKRGRPRKVVPPLDMDRMREMSHA